jgi:hypothetical protein
LAVCVFHRNDRLIEGGGTVVLVRRGVDNYAVTVQAVQHLEDNQVVLTNKPVKILVVYLSTSRPLIASDLSVYLGGCLPVLMAGDLNANNVWWNSMLITKRGRHLRDYAD